MPTVPSRPTGSHLARTVAESFGTDAARYDRARPGYPDALVARVLAASPGPAVLDVGCGTGIAARQFQAAGARVLGVEPDPRMAGLARERGTDVEVATFEDWDPRGRTFDALSAAQCWHWVDPVAGAAKAARVLRPGGLFAEFWHVYEPPPPIADAAAEALRALVPDSPVPAAPGRDGRDPLERYQARIDRTTDGLRAAGGFDAPQRWRVDWERAYTRDQWLDLLPTTGGLTRLPADALAAILAAVGAAIDARGGAFTMEFTTVAVTAARTAAP